MDLSEFSSDPMLKYSYCESVDHNLDCYYLFVKSTDEIHYKKIITIPYCINLLVKCNDKYSPESYRTYKKITFKLA